jgi:hypothetical protein
MTGRGPLPTGPDAATPAGRTAPEGAIEAEPTADPGPNPCRVGADLDANTRRTRPLALPAGPSMRRTRARALASDAVRLILNRASGRA